MTDEQFASDLEAIAASLPDTPPYFAELRALLASLGAPTSPIVRQAREAFLGESTGTGGALSLASPTAVGSESGSIQGITPELFYGQANLLFDPTLENMASTAYNIGAGASDAGEYWRAEHDILTGAGPTTCDWNQLHFRVGDLSNNPFNSAEVEFQVNIPASATTFDVLAYPASNYSPALIPLFPFLTAAVKVRRTNGSAPPAGCTLAIRMQLIRIGDGAVVAETPALDYASLADFDDIRMLSCSGAQTPSEWTSNSYRWRLKLSYAGTGTATSLIRLSIGEPVLQWTTIAAGPPFSPITAQAIPLQLRAKQMANLFLIQMTKAGDTNDRWTVDSSGILSWGSGSAAVDVGLQRSDDPGVLFIERLGAAAASGLDLEAGASTPGTPATGRGRLWFDSDDKHMKQTDDAGVDIDLVSDSGTSFPGSPATNRRVFRTDLGIEFFYNGTRWLSVDLYSMVLEKYNLTFAQPQASATTTALNRTFSPALKGGSDIWLEDYIVSFFVNGGTALSASHKWVGQLQALRDATAGTADTYGTANVDSGASSQVRRLTVALDALLNNGTIHDMLQSSWTKTGTPGDIQIFEEVTYRIVAT